MRNELAVLGPVTSSPAAEQSGKTSLEPGRLDFGLLEAAATGGRPRHALREACRWCDPTSPVRGWCVRIPELVDMFGVDCRTLLRWRAQGISVRQADRLAVRVGLLPDLVWGPRWDEVDL